MTGFLKCYYGYKNRGDELLFFGVIHYICTHYPIKKLYVEVGDKECMQRRLDAHRHHIQTYYNRIELLQIHSYDPKLVHGAMKFFGGGEVLSDEVKITQQEKKGITGKIKSFLGRYFARAGRNYVIKYRRDVLHKNFVLLGGITKPHKRTTKLLYRLLLPRAHSIVCREQTSYVLCQTYTTKAILYQDFAIETLHSLQATSTDPKKLPTELLPKKYILLNIHQHIWSKETHAKILAYCKQHPHLQPVLFPCDMAYDTKFYAILQKDIPNLHLYDRMQHSLQESLAVFAHAAGGIGARLHFLLPLKIYNIPFEPIIYAEKVRKIILN